MEYKLKVQDNTLPIEINSINENSATAKIEDRQYDLKYAVISENERHLIVNGKSINVYVSKTNIGKTIMLNGSIVSRARLSGDNPILPMPVPSLKQSYWVV